MLSLITRAQAKTCHIYLGLPRTQAVTHIYDINDFRIYNTWLIPRGGLGGLYPLESIPNALSNNCLIKT